MSEVERIKPTHIKMQPHQMEIVEAVADTNGVHEFARTGEWVLNQSHVALRSYLERVMLCMKDAATFRDGIKTGIGLLGCQKPISEDIAQSHVYDFHEFREENESLHEAAVRLGFSVIENDPEMVECVRFILPRIGLANEIVFTSGAGYGELLSELAAREEFNSQSALMLDGEFGHELGINEESGIGSNMNELLSRFDDNE